jgi:hypothetical protein
VTAIDGLRDSIRSLAQAQTDYPPNMSPSILCQRVTALEHLHEQILLTLQGLTGIVNRNRPADRDPIRAALMPDPNECVEIFRTAMRARQPADGK